MKTTILMEKDDISRAVVKIASEIVAYNKGSKDLVIIGIRTRGVPLAERVANAIASQEGSKPELGSLDITLYRDDIGLSDSLPIVKKTEIPFNIFNKTIVLVDDVLFTGRTIRAALDAITDYGRPKRILLCVLIDRGNRELPIRADFVARKISTGYQDKVEVHFQESDAEDKVVLKEP